MHFKITTSLLGHICSCSTAATVVIVTCHTTTHDKRIISCPRAVDGNAHCFCIRAKLMRIQHVLYFTQYTLQNMRAQTEE